MQQLQPNTTLQGGKYKILRELGQGGFGITYLAEHTLLEKRVAVKEFFPKQYCDRDEATRRVTLSTRSNEEVVGKFKAKFLKEARNISRLEHPGIVRIHDIFEENGTAYYVMEYIAGGSLAERVERVGALPEAQALRYVEKVGAALEYIHSRRMNHLDVKPANIMLRREDDAPVLIDFGLAKQYDAAGGQTSTTPVGISPGYAPMEQYRQSGVSSFSPQADVYSLGATLYKLLTGTTPPEAAELIESPLTLPAGVSPGVAQAVRKAMAPGRAGRWATVADFCRALAGGAGGDDTVIEVLAYGNGFSATEGTGPSAPGGAAAVFMNETVGGLTLRGTVAVTPAQQSVLRQLAANMVAVEGGAFLMGADDADAYDWEKPVHEETVKPFRINKYEVTQREWRAVMGDNPSFFKGDDLPVETVSYDRCREFTERLRAMTGLPFRMPTEAEWEFAARGGSRSGNHRYSGGSEIDRVAWYGVNSCRKTHFVGMKAPNELGLYDMTGNVWEWTSSFWSDGYEAPRMESGLVYRGGGWSTSGVRCRISYRGYNAANNCYNALGLRLVL